MSDWEDPPIQPRWARLLGGVSTEGWAFFAGLLTGSAIMIVAFAVLLVIAS